MEDVTPQGQFSNPLRFAHCPDCNGPTTIQLELCKDGPHYAKQRCVNCGCFLGWEPNPGEERKGRPAAARKLVQRYGHGYCQMCLRFAGQLPKGQTLEGHHVIPFSEKEAVLFGFAEAGDDSEKNTWILCTSCHRLVDWRRDYRDVREVAMGVEP